MGPRRRMETMLRTRSAFSGCWSSTSRKPGSRPESKTPRPASWASIPSCQKTASLSPGPCGEASAAGGEESEAIGGSAVGGCGFRWRRLLRSAESPSWSLNGPDLGIMGQVWFLSLWAFPSLPTESFVGLALCNTELV